MIISPLKRHLTTIEPQPAAALTYTLKPHGEFINAFRQPRVVVGIIHAARGAQAGFRKTIALILDLSTRAAPPTTAHGKTAMFLDRSAYTFRRERPLAMAA
ncbi:hypothetical protein [Nitrospirillum pindoramense]|uniref:hypothetical protein n=1 Tax=Nitrospirillum amazonense TaxID=28077 RepID=UPI0011AADCCC|nr:hypothetical protein [Nitrospirillum amazonense]